MIFENYLKNWDIIIFFTILNFKNFKNDLI